MPVDRCVCHNVTFAELLLLARLIAPGESEETVLAGLTARTGCCTGCGLCRPYVLATIRTGATRFVPMRSGDAAPSSSTPEHRT